MNLEIFITTVYIISSVLFIVGLKRMSKTSTARKANLLSSLGMLLAIVATLITKGIEFQWIMVGLIMGALIGGYVALTVAMTAMPQMVALLNGSGGLASFLVGWSSYHYHPSAPFLTTISTYLAILIGGVTFTGSVLAWAKLEEKITGKPILFKGQQFVNSLILILLLIGGIIFCMNPVQNYPVFIGIMILSLILGILAVIPIGGADMPVVISLLNSYSGMAGAATGFVIINSMLIVAGSLVGASGIILTQIMCKAMNRSLANVLFSGFGSAVSHKKGAGFKGEVKAVNSEDAYFILEAARSVVFVPGYGLAVAQAQHVLRELGELLEKNGAEVKYAIHPVAGRMPGHMNILLAEANVPYEQLFEMDAINPAMETIDVCVIIGANDVVNPASRHDKSSPIFGMPIIDADKARTVFVLKRSMATGFAGIENELFYYDNTRMVFGDAKATLQGLVAEFKGS